MGEYWGNEKSKAWSRKARIELKKLISDLRDQPCADCGKTYPRPAMQFDHAHGVRSFPPGVSAKNRPLGQILAELSKCDIVCANCHCLRGYERRHGGRKERKVSSCLERLWQIMNDQSHPYRDTALWLYTQAGARVSGNLEIPGVEEWEVYGRG